MLARLNPNFLKQKHLYRGETIAREKKIRSWTMKINIYLERNICSAYDPRIWFKLVENWHSLLSALLYVHTYQIFPARNSQDRPKCSVKRSVRYWTRYIFPVIAIRSDGLIFVKNRESYFATYCAPVDWLTVLYFFASAVCTTGTIFIEFASHECKQYVARFFERFDF